MLCDTLPPLPMDTRLGPLLAEARSATEDGRSAARFFDVSITLPHYAIGKNTETLALHRIQPLSGIIDDFAAAGACWQGIPLLSAAAADRQALIANCASSISPVAVNHRLMSAGFQSIYRLDELIPASAGRLPWPDFVVSMRAEIDHHLDRWEKIFDVLADDESKHTFLDVTRYRLTANWQFMKEYRVRTHEQYFEDFMDYRHEVFVDAGGFDGDTAEAFAQRYPDYKKIIVFEPSPDNMALAHWRLASYRNIDFHPLGLSDQREILKFNPDAGPASSVSNKGATHIQADTLDASVEEPVSFLKMDLEGWEMRALAGARGHLLHDSPKLAIAVYHDSPDLRHVFEFIKGLGIPGKFYLRHYTQGWSETILFFLPMQSHPQAMR